MGVLYELRHRNPDKAFYVVGKAQVCENMKKINVDKVIKVLEQEDTEILMETDLMEAAHKPMIRMLELAAK